MSAVLYTLDLLADKLPGNFPLSPSYLSLKGWGYRCVPPQLDFVVVVAVVVVVVFVVVTQFPVIPFRWPGLCSYLLSDLVNRKVGLKCAHPKK